MRSTTTALIAVHVFAGLALAQANSTYLALGDSVGFGITTGATYTQLSNGDRGYVGLYADWLGTQYGTRPTVQNLSIFGDDTVTYGNTSNPARALNTNYFTAPAAGQSQANAALGAIAAAASAGRPVQRVTVSLGANDLLGVISQPGFLALPPATQGGLVYNALTNVQNNLVTVYGTLRAALPTAEIIAVGYYDAFAVFPGNPNPALTASAINTLNTIIHDTATFFGARYVDVFSVFTGHEAVLTNMLLDTTTAQPNVHPTDAGYAAIAGAIIPTPATGSLLLIGGLAALRRRR